MTDEIIKEIEIKEKQARTKIDKLDILKRLMESEMPDENQACAEYTRRKSSFDASEIQTLKDKIFQIVHQL